MASVVPLRGTSRTRPPAQERRASISPTAWTPSENLEYEAWVLEGRRIGAMGRGSPWWVGDWLLYGSTKWGERYTEATRITGYDKKSLRNMRYVASRFQSSLRRDNLSYSHHAILAPLPEAERSHWFDRATADRLSVADLSLELRRARRDSKAVTTSDAGSPAVADGKETLECPHCGNRVPLPPGVVLAPSRRGRATRPMAVSA